VHEDRDPAARWAEGIDALHVFTAPAYHPLQNLQRRIHDDPRYHHSSQQALQNQQPSIAPAQYSTAPWHSQRTSHAHALYYYLARSTTVSRAARNLSASPARCIAQPAKSHRVTLRCLRDWGAGATVVAGGGCASAQIRSVERRRTRGLDLGGHGSGLEVSNCFEFLLGEFWRSGLIVSSWDTALGGWGLGLNGVGLIWGWGVLLMWILL
jgi:hypothetical protein